MTTAMMRKKNTMVDINNTNTNNNNNNNNTNTNNNNNNNNSASTNAKKTQPSALLLANLIVPFTEHASISLRDVDDALRKRVVVSLTFVDPRRLHALLYPQHHLDWESVQVYLREAHYSPADWVRLVSLFYFINEPPTRPAVAELLTAAAIGNRMSTVGRDLNPVESLQLCFARGGFVPAWDTLCKALLLCNLADVDITNALGLLLQSSSDQPQSQQQTLIESVVRHIPATCKHTPDEYMRAFVQLLAPSGHQVASHVIRMSLKAREDERARTQQAAMNTRRVRPSLTRMLQDADASMAGGSGSFRRFCHEARLPQYASMRFRQACYYVATLPAHVWAQQSPDVRERLFYATACFEDPPPELGVIRAFVRESEHIGPPSCTALQRFRALCPTRSNWTLVLRLYLAAYSRFSKDLWVDLLASPALPSEAEASVQAFTRTNPMALSELAHLMLN